MGVKFLDGGYEWDEAREEASPSEFNRATDKSRILLHAGDVTSHGSFEQFRAEVLANRLSVSADKVEYRFGASRTCIEVSLYDADKLGRFTLPRVNGKPVNLRPLQTYRSPYLNGEFGSDRIAVTVGPVKLLLDFCEQEIQQESERMDPAPLLLANYYAWYHDGKHPARPWAGWTRKESEHNARAIAKQRPGEPPRSSAAYPLAGLYDSADPEVAEWHVRLAQVAGIDAFLVDWWGTHVARDKNIDKGILAAAEKHGFKFALLDERSQFHSDWEWYKEAAVEALARYKDSASYLRIDGRPVYYLYQVAAEATLTPEKFSELKQHVEARVGPVYWIVDKISHNHQGQADTIKHIPGDWLATPGIDCFGFYGTFSNFRAHGYEELIGK